MRCTWGVHRLPTTLHTKPIPRCRTCSWIFPASPIWDSAFFRSCHTALPWHSVHDYYDVARQHGEASVLRRLIAAAHQIGLRDVLNIVLHGCVDRDIVHRDMETLGSRRHCVFRRWLEAAVERSPYRDAHPEWFVRDAAGEIDHTYTWAFDAAD